MIWGSPEAQVGQDLRDYLGLLDTGDECAVHELARLGPPSNSFDNAP